ncbi:MAG: sugar phosphate nucleotidyltransferase [Candidatus Micrarchaeota archaeon]|nr:sugar phosphate nucleotidyltransferase [Candidatus Micrarchaeota archaeon]
METIIPAAGSNHSKILPFSESLPDALIPLNGKPVLDYILDELGRHGIRDVSIVVNASDEQKFSRAKAKYGGDQPLRVIPVSNSRSLLDTIAAAGGARGGNEGVFVVLSDTIFHSKLDFTRSTLYYKITEDVFRWCVAETAYDGVVTRLINKPQVYEGKPHSLLGLYYFSDAPLFFDCLAEARGAGECEISSVIERMMARGHRVFLKECDDWVDCGSVDNYYRAKRMLLQSRHFNSVKVNELFNIITKSSVDADKLEAECQWYLGLPPQLQSFTPRVFSFSRQKGKPAELAMEYYGHPSLSEYFVYTFIPLDIWKSIFSHLFGMLDAFKSYKGSLSQEDFGAIYGEKTDERVGQLRASSDYWARWLEQEEVEINGKRCLGWPSVKKRMVREKFYSERDTAIMHGDLCFTNILYDLNGHTVKLVDPRGTFGKRGIYGDVKYDLAKLRHSAHGQYDFIINDLFSLREKNGSFEYEMLSSEWASGVAQALDARIARMGYDIRTIQKIEALLFLTMIPLHSDKPQRQKMMGARALELFSEVYYEDSD